MPSEDDLRDLFAKAPIEQGGELDVTRVIASSRARRLPGRVAAGAVGTLAVAAILFVGVQVVLPKVGSISSAGSAHDAAPKTAPEGALTSGTSGTAESVKRARAQKINLCEGNLAAPPSSIYGLQLDVTFPATASLSSSTISGTVRLTNTSASHVSGFTAASPAITLSQNAIVLWHSNGPESLLAVQVDLAPGASMEFPATFVAAKCSVSDEGAGGFGVNLTPVAAGSYDLSAAIDFMPDASTLHTVTGVTDSESVANDLVGGPTSAIILQ